MVPGPVPARAGPAALCGVVQRCGRKRETFRCKTPNLKEARRESGIVSPNSHGGGRGSPQLLCRCRPVPGLLCTIPHPAVPANSSRLLVRGPCRKGRVDDDGLPTPGDAPPPDSLCDERRGCQESVGCFPQGLVQQGGGSPKEKSWPAGSLRVLWACRSEPLSYRSRWTSLERCGSRGSGLLGGGGLSDWTSSLKKALHGSRERLARVAVGRGVVSCLRTAPWC